MADVDAILAALTLDEKAALTAGRDFWSTVAVPRLGLAAVGLTDGPNGARGQALGPSAPPSVCVPSGSALGATWNVELLERVGALLGREARDRGCRILLAPTLNLHRSPLAGRNFECYSEDPRLAGTLGAAFVRGVQSQSVIATAKHFVANDAEFERSSISSVVDARALREIYLLPFELAVRDGGALALMTSYNRVNGRWVTEQPELLQHLVRDEWGFAGLVMTDWFGVASTERSPLAGVDLEMPGPGRALGASLGEAVRSGRVPETAVDAMVGRLLHALDQVGALDAPTPTADVLPDRPADRALARQAAIEATVLLDNDGLLPLDPAARRTIAVIGPNAHAPALMGGGSAQVTPHYVRTPLDAIREAVGADVTVLHERGCSIARSARAVGAPGLRVTGDLTMTVASGGTVVSTTPATSAELMFFGTPPGVAGDAWTATLEGRVVAEESGRHELSLAQCGRTRVYLDGALVLDGEDDPPPPGGSDFFGLGSQELVAPVELVAGRSAQLRVEYRPEGAAVVFAAKVGFRPPGGEHLVERAVAAARAADVVVLVVGTNGEWETETRDRESMHLPGVQDALIASVVDANPNTVVVVNAGSPIAMPWAGDVRAVLQCGLGGQEVAGAVADVLFGVAEPSGRLPTTIPLHIEHNPSHDNFPGENGEVRYGEGVFMGYRGYEHRRLPVRYPFGHGLGYTTMSIGAPTLSSPVHTRGTTTTVSVPVGNTGPRRGSEVVQLYVAPVAPRLARPPQELKAFAKVTLDPGEQAVVSLTLDDRTFAYWDPGQPDWPTVEPRLGAAGGVEGRAPAERRAPGWQVDPGAYVVRVGRSSTAIAHEVPVDVVDGEPA